MMRHGKAIRTRRLDRLETLAAARRRQDEPIVVAHEQGLTLGHLVAFAESISYRASFLASLRAA
jgi:hypothetical protein